MNKQLEQGRSPLGVVILIAIIGLVVLFVMSGAIFGVMRGMPGWRLLQFRPFAFNALLPLGLMSVLQIVLAVWVGIDANRKGQSGLLWGLLVLFTSLIGLIVYLLVSPMISSRTLFPARSTTLASTPGLSGGAVCSSCHAEVQSDFRVCPRCGAALARCRQCDKPIRSEWKVCPYCGTAIQG